MAKTSQLVQRSYAILSNDDSEDRACEAIPEAVCSAIPGNYLLNLANGACTKLAEQLASPGLVLPWLLSALGAPAVIASFLMPVKEASSLLPQLAVAAQIRRVARRKWFWVAAGCTQTLCLLLMIPAALGLAPLGAGLTIVFLLGLFSMASGVGSVAFQDVMGKTIPKGRRGRLLSNRAAIGGALTLLAGSLMGVFVDETQALWPFMILLGVAALLWGAAAILFAAIREEPGATQGGRSMLAEVRNGIRLVAINGAYRTFLATRGLLLAVELATPFFALHAQSLFGQGVGALSIYIIAMGFASIVASPFWGVFADTSSRTVLVISGVIGVMAAGIALAFEFLPILLNYPLAYAGVFVILGLAMAGVRLGRKTYLVDAAPGDDRPLYVAFANTTTGMLALVFGLTGLIVDVFSIQVMLSILLLLSFLGAWAAFLLPAPEEFVGKQAAV